MEQLGDHAGVKVGRAGLRKLELWCGSWRCVSPHSLLHLLLHSGGRLSWGGDSNVSAHGVPLLVLCGRVNEHHGSWTGRHGEED